MFMDVDVGGRGNEFVILAERGGEAVGFLRGEIDPL